MNYATKLATWNHVVPTYQMLKSRVCHGVYVEIRCFSSPVHYVIVKKLPQTSVRKSTIFQNPGLVATFQRLLPVLRLL